MHLKLHTRLLSVDLLRAIAAISVYIFHASLFVGFDKFRLPISIPVLSIEFDIPNFFSLGASGVSLFFVISGYCLTRSWYRKPIHNFNYSEYYFRRLARIYPAYIASLLITLIILAIIRWDAPQFSVIHANEIALPLDFFIHALFFQGFLPFSFQSFNGTLWSMSTEIQFYLLLPFIYVLFMRNRPLGSIVLIGLFSLAVRWFASSNVMLAAPIEGGVAYGVLISYGLLGRLFEFAIGIYIAALESRGRLPKFRLTIALFSLGIAGLIRWKGPGWLADPLFGLGYGAILVWLLTNIENVKISLVDNYKILRMGQIFGVYSYSFFLIHWPILKISDEFHWLAGQTDWTRFIIEAPVCFLISYFAAKWMYFNIEEKGQTLILSWRRDAAPVQ